jgi:hypothetical protein
MSGRLLPDHNKIIRIGRRYAAYFAGIQGLLSSSALEAGSLDRRFFYPED